MDPSPPFAPPSTDAGPAGGREVCAALEDVYESAPVPMCVLDGQRLILSANSAFTTLTGLSRPRAASSSLCETLGCPDPGTTGDTTGPDRLPCPLRAAVDDTLATGTVHRDVEVRSGGAVLVAATAPLAAQGAGRVLVCLHDVTERVRAVQALREGEQRFRAIFENAAEGIFQSRPDGRLLRVNPSCARIAGYASPEEMLGAVRDLATDLYARAGAREEFRRLLEEQGEVHGHEAEIRRKDGGSAWISLTARAVRDPAGKALLYEGSFEDVSERREAQIALREKAAFLQTLLDTLPFPVFTKDRQGRYTGCNQAFEVFLGQGRERIVGATVHEIWPPDLAAVYAAADERLFACPGVQIYESALVTPDGARRTVLFQKATFEDASGEVAGLIGAINDVSARRQAEEAGRRQADLDRALSELYRPVVSPETDVAAIAGVVLEVALRLTGSPHGFVSEIDPATGDNVAHSCTSMLDPGEPAALLPGAAVFPRSPDGSYPGLWGHPLNTREGFSCEEPREHPAARGTPPGHQPLERFLAVPVLAGDELVGEIAVANAPRPYLEADVKALEQVASFFALGVQRKRVEEQVRSLAGSLEARVRERTAELEAANRELAAFSYSVSHDLRAPLRAVVGFAQAALEDAGPYLPSGAADDLGRVVAAAERMSHLIDGLLGLSRLSRREMQRVRVDVTALAREVVEELSSLHPERPFQAVVEEGIEAHGDRELLRLVLRNLLDNARKFSARREAPRVEVGTTTSVPVPPHGETGHRVLFVRDNGAGFDMAYAGKLFGPFQRLHSEAEFPGSGIGLASAQRIVHRHGGTIWATGAPGEGATVSFTLGEGGE